MLQKSKDIDNENVFLLVEAADLNEIDKTVFTKFSLQIQAIDKAVDEN